MADNKKRKEHGEVDWNHVYGTDLNLTMATFADGGRIIPKIDIISGRKYIPWVDNGSSEIKDYPMKILEMFYNSSLHNAIIKTKADYIAGGGLRPKDENHPKAALTQQWLDKMNYKGDNAHNVNNKMALDEALMGAHTAQLIYRDDWAFIDSCVFIETGNVRVQTPNDEGEIFGYYWSFDWSGYRPKKMVYLEKFNMHNVIQNRERYSEIIERIMEENEDVDTKELEIFLEQVGNSQLYRNIGFNPNSEYYPIPDYVAVLPAVDTDIQSDLYAISSLKNGMDNGIFIKIIGDAGDRQDQETARRILKSYSGARNAGKPAIVFGESKEEMPEIENITNSNSIASKYRTINDSVQQKIISGHRVPNAGMFGIQTPGKLGNTSEQTDSEEIFYNRWVRPRQKKLEDFWNIVMKYNDLAEVEIINTNVFNENRAESEQSGVLDDNE